MDELLDKAPCGYLSFTDDGLIKRCNSTLASMLGFSREELVGTRLEPLLNIAGRIFFQTHLFPLLKLRNRADEIFLSIVTKNRELIPVITNTIRTEEEGAMINNCVLVPVQQRRKFEDEILQAKKVAEEALNENKELIKARQEIESHSRKLDSQLHKINQFNNEWLEFNKIINHDMQECIRKIVLFTGISISRNDDQNLEKVLKAAKRLDSINRNLQSYIGLGFSEERFTSLDLAQLVRDAIDQAIQENSFSNIKSSVSELPIITGAASQFKILFRELINNAIKFKKGELLRLDIEHVVYESNLYRNVKDRYDYGEVLKITLKDNGLGFDNMYSEQVFQMLNKLDKHSDTGLGLGLSLCKKVVDNHLGEISISSEEGVGTTVAIILPLRARV